MVHYRKKVICGHMALASRPAVIWAAFIDFRRPLEKDGFWAAVYYIDGFWTAY